MRVALLEAPDGFDEFVRAPEGVEFSRRWENQAKLVILFARSANELDMLLSPVAAQLGPRRLWICWPKATSTFRAGRSDLTQFVVLQGARAYNLKTSKIISIDNDWSAMRFSVAG